MLKKVELLYQTTFKLERGFVFTNLMNYFSLLVSCDFFFVKCPVILILSYCLLCKNVLGQNIFIFEITTKTDKTQEIMFN